MSAPLYHSNNQASVWGLSLMGTAICIIVVLVGIAAIIGIVADMMLPETFKDIGKS